MTAPTSDERRDVTARLTVLAAKRMANMTPYWATEVDLDMGKMHRVDLMGFVPLGSPTGSDVSRVEGGTFVCCEVKSCMDDFNSGHGLNFWGDQNWLVCPKALADEVRGNLPLGVKLMVLCPDAGGRRLVMRYDLSGTHALHRTQPASVMMFALLRAIKNGRGDGNAD